MTALEVLRAARAYVAQPGHWMHPTNTEWTRGVRRACVSNACTWAQSDEDRHLDAQRLLIRLLGAERGHLRAVFDWNDAPERTLDDVLALFDEAIAIEEAKAQEFTVVEPAREVERV